MQRYEIRLAGTGGQGQILAGIILAEAAAIYEGLNAVQSQSYGPESRGGASKAEVVISDGEIDYPKVTVPDFLLVMSKDAWGKYGQGIGSKTKVLIDSTLVSIEQDSVPEGTRLYKLPITGMAKDLGKEIVANIVALGAITAISGVVSRDAVEEAVLSRVPKGTEELNKKALSAGYDAAMSLVAVKE